MKFLSFLCTKWMGNCEAMTSSTRSFAYSYQLVKKCFLKICETSKCHNFLIFQPIFIRFSLFYSQIFTLSYEIKLNLFRISPSKRQTTINGFKVVLSKLCYSVIKYSTQFLNKVALQIQNYTYWKRLVDNDPLGSIIHDEKNKINGLKELFLLLSNVSGRNCQDLGQVSIVFGSCTIYFYPVFEKEFIEEFCIVT